MPKGPQGQRRTTDVIGNAVHIAQVATGETQETALKQPAKRNSGLAGAKVYTQSLTLGERVNIGKKGAQERWQ